MVKTGCENSNSQEKTSETKKTWLAITLKPTDKQINKQTKTTTTNTANKNNT